MGDAAVGVLVEVFVGERDGAVGEAGEEPAARGVAEPVAGGGGGLAGGERIADCDQPFGRVRAAQLIELVGENTAVAATDAGQVGRQAAGGVAGRALVAGPASASAAVVVVVDRHGDAGALGAGSAPNPSTRGLTVVAGVAVKLVLAVGRPGAGGTAVVHAPSRRGVGGELGAVGVEGVDEPVGEVAATRRCGEDGFVLERCVRRR